MFAVAAQDDLTPQDALTFADALLADARASDNTYVRQRLCSLIDDVFARVGSSVMEALRSSTTAEDQDTIVRVDRIYAEKEGLLILLDTSALIHQPAAIRSATSNRNLLAGLDAALLNLRNQVMDEHEFGLYVPLMAKANLQVRDDVLFPLIDKALGFLDGDGQVMLLLGDSGAGKTIFSHQLELLLWKNYQSEGPIPLYINLPTIDGPDCDIVAKQLHRHDFAADQIQELRRHRQFILICDGYDECQQLPNLYHSNQFNTPGQWRAKLFISCRSEYVGSDYRNRFQPTLSDQKHDTTLLFQEAVVAPFSTNQILVYINQYIASSSNSYWTTQEYVDRLNMVPGLMELVQNPFLLTLALESLPKVLNGNGVGRRNDRISRVALYDGFIEQWLETGKQRLQESPLTPEEHTLFYHLLDDGVYEKQSIQFLKDLSTTIFINQGGNPIVRYSEQADDRSWKSLFFSPQAGVKIFRQSSPLTRSGDYYRFIHRSWLEYFYSRVVYDPDDTLDDGSAQCVPFLNDPTQLYLPIIDQPLSRWSIIAESSIIQFLAERVQGYSSFKESLLTLIELSKSDTHASQAASNAITILVRAGVRFNGAELQEIRIPGADLSGGQFDSAQLQDSDLTGVNLSKAWIRQVDLSRACLENTRLGELPWLEEDDAILSCAFSPNGRSLAVSTYSSISIYNTATWRKTHTLLGQNRRIYTLVYSPSSKQLLFGADDKTVRLWNCQTGSTMFVMEGHTNNVTAVAFSPSGKQAASVSRGQNVRLWNVETGTAHFVLSGHTDNVSGIAYSPDSNTIVSCSRNTVRMFDTQTGQILLSVGTSDTGAGCVAYSPDGQRIVFAARAGGLHLWKAGTLEPEAQCIGHTQPISSVEFSPNGHLIVSCSNDNTVLLWDASTFALISSFLGHTQSVHRAVFSPNGLQIASASTDKTVRLWDISSIGSGPDTEGLSDSFLLRVAYSPDGQVLVSASHTGVVQYNGDTGEPGFALRCEHMHAACVAYSSSGHQISMAGIRGDVTIWNTQVVVVELSLRGHRKLVTTTVFSPCGNWIASASLDKTVRLWHADSGTASHVLWSVNKAISGDAAISLSFAPNGLELAAGFQSGDIRVWEVKSGECKMLMSGNPGRCFIRYLPGTAQIASCHESMMGDAEVRLWDEEGKDFRRILQSDLFPVQYFAFSSCGQWIVSSKGCTAQLWKRVLDWMPQDWEHVTTIDGCYGDILEIAWRPRMQEFATASYEGCTRVWRVVEEPDRVSVQLVWSSGGASFTAAGALLNGAVGLSTINRSLFEQRGAFVESSSLGDEV